MIINEQNFIGQLKLHNEHALMYVIDVYGGLVQSVIKKHLYAIPDHQGECFDDVLLAVWKHIGSFEPDKNSFKNWIAAIARYKAIDYLRKYKDKEVFVPYNDAQKIAISPVDEGNTGKAFIGEVVDFLNCLKPEDREIFVKLYLEGESVDEISAATGLSKPVIYNRISRGRRRIQKSVKEKENE